MVTPKQDPLLQGSEVSPVRYGRRVSKGTQRYKAQNSDSSIHSFLSLHFGFVFDSLTVQDMVENESNIPVLLAEIKPPNMSLPQFLFYE